jgi:hypothetical protein
LPLGEHTFSASVPGLERWEQRVNLETQELSFLPFVMEPAGSPWETLVLYAPFDQQVGRWTVEKSQLRMYCEHEALSGDSELHVLKPFWGPDRDFEPGTLLLELPFSGAVEDLEVEFASFIATVPERHMLVEMGPDREHMLTVVESWPVKGMEELPCTRIPETWNEDATFAGIGFHVPTRERMAPLVAAMRDKARLFVRWTVDGVVAGDEKAYAFAMRTNALPFRNKAGKLLWNPALTVRARISK